MTAVRIGIDGSCWMNRRGFGRFTRALVGEMLARDDGHTYVVLIDAPSAPNVELPGRPEIVPVRVRDAPATAAAASGNRRAIDVMRMTHAARRSRCDVFFFPATYSWFPVPGIRSVVTVHDAIAEMRPDEIFADRRSRVLWTVKQQAALRTAKRVVTVSDAARREIERELHVDPERITVIHEAPDARFRPTDPRGHVEVRTRFGLGAAEPYVLYVGGISPHKNLETLVRAFEQVARSHPSVRLVLVGDTDDDPFLSSTDRLRDVIARSPVEDRIGFTGYVSDDDLVQLYGGAVTCVQPSRGEGYGLTAAESAACGTPVVASAIPALQELLGDAALYAPPDHPDAFAQAIETLLTDPAERARLGREGVARARAWTWATAAATTVALLEDVSGG